MNINQIIKLINKDIININAEIDKQLQSEITLITKLSKYIMSNKGKQIRPMISILITKALRYKKNQHIIIAALIEFIHTATLLHDDIIDKSIMRRGKITANIIFGNDISMLVGNFMYTRAFQMMTQLKSLKIFNLMANAVNTIASGEILQLTHRHDPSVTKKKYMKIIYKKTARLFEVSAQISAIIANANSDQEKALSNYGKHIGIAFQMINDLLDYNISKNFSEEKIGNDLNEGKLTLPLIHAMQHSTLKQIKIIHKAIKQGNNHHLLQPILHAMHQYKSLEYTQKKAEDNIIKAISYLKVLSPSPYKQALKYLAYIVIQKKINNNNQNSY